MLRAVGALSAAPDADEAPRSKFGLHEPGVLEGMAEAAGLRPVEAHDVITAMEFGDEERVRELLSPGSVVLATRIAGEAAVRAAIRDALAPFRMADGTYRVENEWHYLVSSPVEARRSGMKTAVSAAAVTSANGMSPAAASPVHQPARGGRRGSRSG